MNKYKLFSWSAIIISIWLLILPRLIPICDAHMKNGQPMHCHYAYQAEFLVALLAVILSTALIVLRSAEARLLNGFTLALLGIIIIVLPQPWVLGICENGACLKTAFFGNIGASLLILASAGIIGVNWHTQEK